MINIGFNLIMCIAPLLISPNAESRYMGLYFLSHLIDRGEYITYAQDTVTTMITTEQDTMVKTELMWLMGKLVKRGMLHDQALAIAQKELYNINAFVRMWALELYGELFRNNVPINDIANVLASAQCDDDLFVMTEALFLQDMCTHSYDNVPTIVHNIERALHVSDEQSQHFGLYFLSKLVNRGQMLEYAYAAVLNALQKTDKVKIQALWVLSKLVQHDVGLKQALEIVKNEMHNKDWHVRFGTLMVLEALINKQPDDQELALILHDYDDDPNEFIQVYRVYLQESYRKDTA